MEQDFKKERSPKAPKLSLEESIERVRRIYQKAGKAAINKEVLVQAIGYSGISGASLTVLATLRQYGLLEANGDLLYVSPLSLRLLHPVNTDQETKARRESALLPQVFFQLNSEGFHIADEDVICNHLIQSGFATDGARVVARIFKENTDFAKLNEQVNNTTGLEVFESDQPKLAQNQAFKIEEPASRSTQTGYAVPAGYLPIPIGDGRVAVVPLQISEEDFELFRATLDLWKKKIVRAETACVS
jgi:hypothetical protein